jgi:hypothetical protein
MSASLGPRGMTYKDLTSEPYYRFGYGLSYTNVSMMIHTVVVVSYTQPTC